MCDLEDIMFVIRSERACATYAHSPCTIESHDPIDVIEQ